MHGDRHPTPRGLVLCLAAGGAVAVLVVAVGPLVGFGADPAATVLLGLFVGGLVWLAAWRTASGDEPPWRRPEPPAELAQLTTDARTRRITSMLVHSTPGGGFESTSLAAMLGELAAHRLVCRHGLPSEDPLGHADGLLSPPLLAHLRAERPPALKRSTLHAYLKEIDEL